MRNGDVYRWTSLPRVSQIGGKRPDHLIQYFQGDSSIFIIIESKLKGKDLEDNIGESLKVYIDDLFKTLPTAYKIVIAIGDYLMKRNVHWIIIQHYLLVHLYIQTMKNLKRI